MVRSDNNRVRALEGVPETAPASDAVGEVLFCAVADGKVWIIWFILNGVGGGFGLLIDWSGKRLGC